MVWKWWQIRIFTSQKNHVNKIWKTAFPKEFFNDIWLNIANCEYKIIYITGIKLWNLYTGAILEAIKPIVSTPHANLC